MFQVVKFTEEILSELETSASGNVSALYLKVSLPGTPRSKNFMYTVSNIVTLYTSTFGDHHFSDH